MAGALAAFGEPTMACQAGMEALAIAQQASSVRTAAELARVSQQLRPWQHRSDVRELKASLLAV